MYLLHAGHRDRCGVEPRWRTACGFHGAANRLDTLPFGLRELQPAEEPGQALVAPDRRHPAPAEILDRQAGRKLPGRDELDAILVRGESRRVKQLVVPVSEDVTIAS